MDNLPRTSGIYKITCILTGKFYVGSSNNIRQRWASHCSELRNGRHGNRHLQNAWNKYGEKAFIVEVLEFVMPWSILEREQYWLDKLNPFGDRGFNGNRVADKPPSPKGRILSDETKSKLSIANKGKQNALGNKHTPEEIAKIAASKIGKKRAPFSDEWRTNLGLATKGKPLSSEHRAKVSAARKGHKVSEETRAKISATKRRQNAK